MTSRFMLIFAAISGFIFVALGAFGAHVLSKTMGAVEMGWIQTGLEYQAFHTLAILGLAVAMQRRISIWFYWSSVFLALGTVLFSGSLYCLALSQSAFVGVCHSGWRRELPRGLGVNVSWCYPF
ncbi:inner membrane protein YgdD [Escherichia coli]|uniref:Inner membrane protein YgdD n=1 Tax=Escherichia coli TaxID=562 RepID=A0A2X1KAY0_ECOLX|nr:inner membrane protein YgdD [Escherichia coli]